jgi:hypothetical protein
MSEEKNWHERLLEESDELGKKVDRVLLSSVYSIEPVQILST